MKKDKKISVIITTYNRKEYLKKAIESVLKQTYKNYEIIIIDDFSQDGTTEEIKKMYQNYNNISIYRNEENKGPGISRKYALDKKAEGEYLIFLDDDDIFIDSEYFEKAVKLFEENEKISMVCCNHIVYSTMKQEKQEIDFKYDKIVDNKEFFINFGKENFRKPTASFAIFRKESFEKTSYKEMKIFNDTTMFLRALLYGDMGFINTFGGQYLIHGENISFHCDCDFILDNLREKYAVYQLAKTIFQIDSKKLKKWLIEQADITIIYYIKGSKPNKKELNKIYYWTIRYLKSIECVRKYKKIAEEFADKEKIV